MGKGAPKLQKPSSLPVEKVIHGLFPLENLRFLRVLRTRDRIVRSNTWFIHSLLASAFAVLVPFFPLAETAL